MSTRCQIAFYDNKPLERRGYYDSTYMAARILQKLMNDSDNDMLKYDKNYPIDNMVTGFGIDNETHDDLSYYYEITEKHIRARSHDEEGEIIKEITLK